MENWPFIAVFGFKAVDQLIEVDVVGDRGCEFEKGIWDACKGAVWRVGWSA